MTDATGRRGSEPTRAGTRITRAGRRVALLVLVCAVLAAGTAPVAADGAATITLSVDGAPVEAGGTVDVERDPTLGIEAEADSAIEAVIVRLDGDTVETYEGDATSFDGGLQLDLADGGNAVRVIVETADGVESQRITITKDDRAPFIEFDGPFETDHHRDVIPEEASVDGGKIVLKGTLVDASGVRHLSIHRQFIFYHANVQHSAEDRWDIEDPGSSFSQEILLGNGTNTLSIRVTDRMGHARDYTIDLTVNDTEAPQIDLQLPNETGRSSLPIGGEVRDNTQLDRITVGVEGSLDSKILFDGIDDDPDPAAGRLAIPGTVPLRPGENVVTVTATDLAGNTASASQTVVYERTIVPAVTFDRDATALEAGTIHLVGTVTDGEITGVTVETVAVESGAIVDLARVYTDGSVRGTVPLNESLQLADGETRLVVRATDSEGVEHRTALTVHLAGDGISWPGGAASTTETPTPTPTPTPTATATPGTEPEPAATPTATPAPEQDEGLMGLTSAAEGLPGFTPLTAAAALLVFALVAVHGRRHG